MLACGAAEDRFSNGAICPQERVVKGDVIGSASNFVAVPPDRDAEPVREFASVTVDLNALTDWLEVCRGAQVSCGRGLKTGAGVARLPMTM